MCLFLFLARAQSSLLSVNKSGFPFLVHERFDSETLFQTWLSPTSPDYPGQWDRATVSDRPLLRMATKNAFHGIAAQFSSPLNFANRSLVIQYFVQPRANVSCSGAYLKLFSSPEFNPLKMERNSPYLLMFGPDKCGETDKVHFIFQHRNLLTGGYEEKHFVDAPRTDLNESGARYQLVVNATNKFQISVNGRPVAFGNLLLDFKPPVNPPREIDDPTDKKPADWVDDQYVIVPGAKKPQGWDDGIPEFIPDPAKVEPPVGWLFDAEQWIADPEAREPSDWDVDLMGEWTPPKIENPICQAAPGCGKYEPPLIRNPDYRGEWEPPMMINPEYRGEWKARRIANPKFYEDLHPHNFEPFTGVAFDLWTVDGGIGFADLIISDDPAAVERYNRYGLPSFEGIPITEQIPPPSGNLRVDSLPLIATAALTLGPALLLLCLRGRRSTAG
jgi:calnexin